MAKRPYRYKLLFDENMPHRELFPSLNKTFNIKHIAADLNLAGMPDPKVYELAVNEKRLLVTYNIKDFTKIASKNTNTGIIGVSASLTLSQVDKKLTALFTK